jgi:S1-C subfamily serine protease
VSRVVPFGVADRKGVTAGDRIIAVGRTEIRGAREARSLVRAAGRGDVLSLLLETASGRTYIANLRVP